MMGKIIVLNSIWELLRVSKKISILIKTMHEDDLLINLQEANVTLHRAIRSFFRTID